MEDGADNAGIALSESNPCATSPAHMLVSFSSGSLNTGKHSPQPLFCVWGVGKNGQCALVSVFLFESTWTVHSVLNIAVCSILPVWVGTKRNHDGLSAIHLAG